MKKSPINILYSGDQNVTKGLLLSILSVLKHETERPVNFYILTMSYTPEKKTKYTGKDTKFYMPGQECKAISEETVAKLDKIAREKNAGARVRRFDVSKLVIENMPKKNLNNRFSPCCMLRIFANLMPELPEKLLYLDTDVMAIRPIDELWDTDMSGYELAGVLDNYGKHYFHKDTVFRQDYLNSGVLLMNMKMVQKSALLDRARKMCCDKKMFMPDQSALNKLCEKRLILPRKFNEQKEMREDTVLRHFTTTVHFLPPRVQKIKPWHVEKLHKVLKTYAFDDIIEEYRARIKEVNE